MKGSNDFQPDIDTHTDKLRRALFQSMDMGLGLWLTMHSEQPGAILANAVIEAIAHLYTIRMVSHLEVLTRSDWTQDDALQLYNLMCEEMNAMAKKLVDKAEELAAKHRQEGMNRCRPSTN